MAKQRPLPPFSPELTVRESAKIVVAVRIKEILSHIPAALNPERKRAIHDMRISFKRLRYCLEFLKPWLNPDYGDILKEFKKYQDLLGNIHDCDILVELLKSELAHYLKSERRFWKALRSKEIEKVSLHEFEYQLKEFSKGDPKLGLADWLLRTLKTRHQLFEEFVERWHKAQSNNFWGRVLALTLDPEQAKFAIINTNSNDLNPDLDLLENTKGETLNQSQSEENPTE